MFGKVLKGTEGQNWMEGKFEKLGQGTFESYSWVLVRSIARKNGYGLDMACVLESEIIFMLERDIIFYYMFGQHITEVIAEWFFLQMVG